MVFRGGPHQRGLAEAIFPRVDRRAALDEQPHGFRVAGAGGGHQHRLAFFDHGLRIGARLQQDLDHVAVGVAGGKRQRRDAVAVDGVSPSRRPRSAASPSRDLRRAQPTASGVVPSASAALTAVLPRRDEHRAHRVTVAGFDGVDEREPVPPDERRQRRGRARERSQHSGFGMSDFACAVNGGSAYGVHHPSRKQFDRRVSVAELLHVARRTCARPRATGCRPACAPAVRCDDALARRRRRRTTTGSGSVRWPLGLPMPPP